MKARGPSNFVTGSELARAAKSSSQMFSRTFRARPRPPWSHRGGVHPSSKVQDLSHFQNWLRLNGKFGCILKLAEGQIFGQSAKSGGRVATHPRPLAPYHYPTSPTGPLSMSLGPIGHTTTFFCTFFLHQGPTFFCWAEINLHRQIQIG